MPYRPYHELSVRLIDRAKEGGTLRADFVAEDLVLLLMANAGVVQAAGPAAPDAWKRLVGLMLNGFRSEGAGELSPPPTPRHMMMGVDTVLEKVLLMYGEWQPGRTTVVLVREPVGV